MSFRRHSSLTRIIGATADWQRLWRAMWADSVGWLVCAAGVSLQNLRCTPVLTSHVTGQRCHSAARAPLRGSDSAEVGVLAQGVAEGRHRCHRRLKGRKLIAPSCQLRRSQQVLAEVAAGGPTAKMWLAAWGLGTVTGRGGRQQRFAAAGIVWAAVEGGRTVLGRGAQQVGAGITVHMERQRP